MGYIHVYPQYCEKDLRTKFAEFRPVVYSFADISNEMSAINYLKIRHFVFAAFLRVRLLFG